MARKVRCAVTREYGTSDTFIKIGNKYYKSQQIYDEYEKEKVYRQKILDMISVDFLDYSPGQTFPTLIVKQLKQLDFYSKEVIYQTFLKCYDNIMYYLKNKDFKDDCAKIRYIFAIIKNNINDVYKADKIQKARKIEESQHEFADIERAGIIQKGKDISKWLEEE